MRAERALGAAEVEAIEPAQNPSLVLTHQQTLHGPTDRETVVGVELPFSISGRRGVLRDAARARQHAIDARARIDLFETALDFREAFALAVVEHERSMVMAQQQKSLEALARALEQLTARGEIAQYDVARHRAEVRLHARALASARARAGAAHRRLSRWLGEPMQAPPSTAALARTRLVPEQITQHPKLAMLRETSRAAGLESAAARRRWIPDPGVFAGYRQVASGAETGHGVSVGLQFPLTISEHGQGASSRARAEQQLADAHASRLERELAQELSVAVASLRALEAALEQAEAGVADTERLEQSAAALYSAGEASITELLDAYRTRENAALDRLVALEELLAARLAVMRAAGKQFEPELDAICGSQKEQVR
ncbi:MAG TPA: TolC family protein [Polyangiaceae bacterium]|nr:TolC family protein [Polyangiaceae bacterium]